jgi:hypothetical protein
MGIITYHIKSLITYIEVNKNYWKLKTTLINLESEKQSKLRISRPRTFINILGPPDTIEESRLLAIVRRGSCLLDCEHYERYY